MAIQIHNWQEFSDIRNDLTADYELASDIDFALAGNWQSIGGWIDNSFVRFTGTLDGKGYALKNLYFDDPTGEDSYVGVFGAVANATFKNLVLDNITIDDRSDWKWCYGFIGEGTENITFENIKIKNSTILQDGGSSIGFLLGGYEGWECTFNNAQLIFENITIENCNSRIFHTASASDTGMLVGFFYEGGMYAELIINNITIHNDENSHYEFGDSQYGLLIGTGYMGLVVKITNIDIKTDIISVNGTDTAGFVIGSLYANYDMWVDNPEALIEDTMLKNCFVKGNITTTSFVEGVSFYAPKLEYFGGIIGNNPMLNMVNCHFKGNIEGTGYSIGGLCSMIYSDGVRLVEYCSVESNLISAGRYSGVLFGDIYGHVEVSAS